MCLAMANSIPQSEPQTRRAKVSARFILAAACLLFCVQQVPYFQTRWIEDENSYSDAAWSFAREGRIRMSMYAPTDVGSVVDVRPPAMPIVLGSFFKVLSLGIWQARVLPFLAALGAVLVTYLLGGYLFGEWGGAVAALLVATDSMLFVAGRTTRPEAVVAFLGTLAAFLFIKAMRQDSWRVALAAGLVAGLSMNFHLNGIIAPITMGLWALYEYGWKVWRKPVPWAFAVALALCVMPYVLWINADALHRYAYSEMRALAITLPFSKFHGEVMRYSDFIGVGSIQLKPVAIPARAPIALFILGSLGVLYVRNRRLFWYLGLFLAVHMGEWFYVANKTVRYTAVAAPLFALIVVAGSISFATTARRRQIAVGVCLVYAVIGVVGNVYLVNRFKKADYITLTAQLRQAIPPGSTAFGAHTFWLALHDRRYYSFDRSPFDYTIANLKPEYLILYDRVFMTGSEYEDNLLRDQFTTYVKSNAKKIAVIPSEFYGNLEIYRVNTTKNGDPSRPE
jgi:4-amino-4-deoxy-L-arabinose transferase-like glycosyltransferase